MAFVWKRSTPVVVVVPSGHEREPYFSEPLFAVAFGLVIVKALRYYPETSGIADTSCHTRFIIGRTTRKAMMKNLLLLAVPLFFSLASAFAPSCPREAAAVARLLPSTTQRELTEFACYD